MEQSYVEPYVEPSYVEPQSCTQSCAQSLCRYHPVDAAIAISVVLVLGLFVSDLVYQRSAHARARAHAFYTQYSVQMLMARDELMYQRGQR